MSRIGKMPINVPAGTEVSINKSEVSVKGPKGELSQTFNADMSITLENNVVTVSRPSDEKTHRAMHGLTRSLLSNMVVGVSQGFERYLDIVGVGYRAEQAGEKLTLRIGFSHTVEVTPLPGVSLAVEGINRIKVSGISKEAVGEMAARIRAVRRPDAYKGKGIRYSGEVVRLKPGKAGKVVGK
ncbi:50S ribosomal protein L6 [Chloroflexota bacterium]